MKRVRRLWSRRASRVQKGSAPFGRERFLRLTGPAGRKVVRFDAACGCVGCGIAIGHACERSADSRKALLWAG